jgi:hypothetical protein
MPRHSVFTVRCFHAHLPLLAQTSRANLSRTRDFSSTPTREM